MKFMKKSAAFLLTLVMLLGLTVPALAAEGDNPFTDVAKGSYYYDAVIWAKDSGVTTGVTATQFQPNGTCTRGQVATFLWRAKGEPEPSIENPFKDVAASSPFYKAILWAYENGITTGVTADTFNPNGTCSNAHVVTFLWRAMGEPSAKAEGTAAAAYADGAYYKEAVAWADTKGLLSGVGGAFAPNEKSPRANIVTYLYRSRHDVLIYDLTVTDSSHKDGTLRTNTSSTWLRYYMMGDVALENWDTGAQKPVSNLYNNVKNLPAGEALWFSPAKLPDINADYYEEVTVTYTYMWDSDRGTRRVDMKNQEWGPEFFVSGDNGSSWSEKSATMAKCSDGVRITMNETGSTPAVAHEAYLYEITSTNLVDIADGKITDIRIYPNGTDVEDPNAAFSPVAVRVDGKLKEGVSLDDIPTGYDPGVNLGNPWASDPTLASYEIFGFVPSGTGYDYDGGDLTVNSTRGWMWTATVNGKKTVPIMGIYNNTSASGGLSDGKTLMLEMKSIPNIDTSVFGAANIKFQYVYAPEDSDLKVNIVDELQVQISTDNAKSWITVKDALRSHELQGTALTSNGKSGVLYEATTKDFTDAVPAGAVITDVRLKPFGDYPRYYGAFRLVSLSVDGYKTDLPAYTEETVGTISVPEETLRQITVDEAHKTANYEWTHPEDLKTYNWNGGYNASSSATAKALTYYGGWLHKGPVYTRSPLWISSSEMWMDSIENGVLTADADGGRDGIAEDTVVGMDCSTFVFNATSRISPAYDWNGQLLVINHAERPLVAPLSNERRDIDNNVIYTRYSEQELYQHFANAQVGDICDTVGNAAHERLVTVAPNVVYKADGTIDPNKSTLGCSESGDPVYYFWQTPEGETVRNTTDPAVYQKYNPTHKYLYGRSTYCDEIYTFAALYRMKYVIHTLKEYQEEKVDKLDLNIVTEAAGDTVVSEGFMAALESNYRMIAVTAKIMKGSQVVFEDKDYLQQRSIVHAYSNSALDTAMRKLASGSYTLVLDVQAGPVTTVGGEVPVTRVLELPFTTDGKAATKLTVAEDTFSGFDLGFAGGNTLLAVRFAKPNGTDWGNKNVDVTIRIQDKNGMDIQNYTETRTIGHDGGSNYMIGKGNQSMRNGYTLKTVSGLENVTVTVTVVDDGITWQGKATGLTIYKAPEAVEVPVTKTEELKLAKGTFGGSDLGFNSTGKFLCFRFEKVAGIDWSKTPTQSYSVLIKDSSGKAIVEVKTPNDKDSTTTLGFGGTGNAYYQIGKSAAWMKNGYTIESTKGLTNVSVELEIVYNGTSYQLKETGLTISK